MDSNKKFHGAIWLTVILYSLLAGQADAKPIEEHHPLDDVEPGVHLFEGSDELFEEEGLLTALQAHCDRIEYGFKCEKTVLVSLGNEVAVSNNYDAAFEMDSNGVIAVHHANDPEDRQLLALSSGLIFAFMIALFAITVQVAAFISYRPHEIPNLPRCDRPAMHLNVVPNVGQFGGLEGFANRCWDEAIGIDWADLTIETVDQFLEYGNEIYMEGGFPLDAKVLETFKVWWGRSAGQKTYILAGAALVQHMWSGCFTGENALELVISIGVNRINEEAVKFLVEKISQMVLRHLDKPTQDMKTSITIAKVCETNKKQNRPRHLLKYRSNVFIYDADDDFWFDDDDW